MPLTTAIRRLPALAALALVLGAATARAQLTMEITVPASTPAGATVYVAGTFNGWNPGDPAYALTDAGGDLHVITLPDSVRGFIQFKFTLGGWETVEQDANGNDVPNRFFAIPQTGTATYTGSVARWRDDNVWPLPNSTATDSVSILAFDWPIPQLERTRRIWLYLPPDYATSSKRYPVLYMQDGQNVFDAATSFAGEWGVDEALDAAHAQGHWGAIVVAIANGEAHRADEYHPWPHPQYGGGEADLYLDFLVDDLKPYIDANYRTLTNPRNTGVGGSSSAGLFAFYAGLREPGVFGRVLAFSSAFFANPEIYPMAAGATPTDPPARFAFVAGLNETVGSLPPNTFADAQTDMVDTLASAGFDTIADVLASLPADGAHAEWFWQREFPGAHDFLFAPTLDSDADGIADLADNCTLIANADQRDTDGDGYGNRCDGDLNGDGAVNAVDLGLLRSAFFGTGPHGDFNGDGVVNALDLGILKTLFFAAPGPSGRAP